MEKFHKFISKSGQNEMLTESSASSLNSAITKTVKECLKTDDEDELRSLYRKLASALADRDEEAIEAFDNFIENFDNFIKRIEELYPKRVQDLLGEEGKLNKHLANILNVWVLEAKLFGVEDELSGAPGDSVLRTLLEDLKKLRSSYSFTDAKDTVDYVRDFNWTDYVTDSF